MRGRASAQGAGSCAEIEGGGSVPTTKPCNATAITVGISSSAVHRMGEEAWIETQQWLDTPMVPLVRSRIILRAMVPQKLAEDVSTWQAQQSLILERTENKTTL